MKEPVPNRDRQDNLLQPIAREPDSRERALLEENLAAVRELRDLLRESATDPEDKILPALRRCLCGGGCRASGQPWNPRPA